MTKHDSAGILDTVLLLALPASGKSEVRHYLAQLSADEARRDFHLGPTLQLDDYPYVHMMRRVDDELARLGKARMFFRAPDQPFQDPRDWGTLIEFINEDYADLRKQTHCPTEGAGRRLLERLEASARRAGLPPRLSSLDDRVCRDLSAALDSEARRMAEERNELSERDLTDKTIVIEFARGGPEGSGFPLPAPLGYGYSLARLSPEILSRARILYVWVTPEESRRKNRERARPDEQGSILHHGVPDVVMRNDYGCDDMDWLESQSAKKGCARIESRGSNHDLPIARFDNRVDKTSFLRGDRGSWMPAQVKAVHEGLREAFARLAQPQ